MLYILLIYLMSNNVFKTLGGLGSDHYVAASTCCSFLPYDLITVQNWCHLFWILNGTLILV